MAGLRHPNIVTFFGAGVDQADCEFLITELMSRGSLTSVLLDQKAHPTLAWSSRLGFARDIASGMLFLHSRKPPMLHRDLKSDNVLLDDRWAAKVGQTAQAPSVTPAEIAQRRNR